MSNLLLYLLEASLVLLVLFTFYIYALRYKAAPGFNRFYLLFSLILHAVIPLISVPFPTSIAKQESLLLPATQFWNFLPELVISAGNSAPAVAASYSINGLTVTAFCYLLGALVSLGFTSWKLAKLYTLIRQISFRVVENERYRIAETNGRLPTFSFWNYIFWDNSVPLNPTEAQQILQHELAHIRQKHSLDLILTEFLTVIFWFNPLIYLFRRYLLQEHEYLADRFAVEGTNADFYINLMVKQTFREAGIPLTSSFFQHNTLNRIRMLQTKSNRSYLRAAFGALLIGFLFFIAACEDESKETILPPNGSSVAQNERISPPSPQLQNSEKVFEVVEEMPVPKEGMEALYKTIGETLEYPEEAVSKGIERRVNIYFVVEKDGTLSELKTVKSIEVGKNEAEIEAILESRAIEAILATSGQWEPGRQRGQTVRTRMVMPIVFKL